MTNRLLAVSTALVLSLGLSAAEGQGKPAFVSAPAGAQKTVVLSFAPDNLLEAAAMGEIVASHLMAVNTKVISNEALSRVRETMLRKAADSAEDAEKEQPAKGKEGDEKVAKPAKKRDVPLIDGLAVAKEAGADCLVKIMVSAQAVQQNIYDKENRRVTEVRTETRVALVTVSVLDTEGRILKVGSLSYPEPATVAGAAAEVGQALAEQLAKK